MTGKHQAANQITITGSNLNAGNIVAGNENDVSGGEGARLMQITDVHGREVAARLELLRNALEANESSLADGKKARRSLKAVAQELRKENPDQRHVSDRLNGLAAAVGLVPAVTNAIESLRSVLLGMPGT